MAKYPAGYYLNLYQDSFTSTVNQPGVNEFSRRVYRVYYDEIVRRLKVLENKGKLYSYDEIRREINRMYCSEVSESALDMLLNPVSIPEDVKKYKVHKGMEPF